MRLLLCPDVSGLNGQIEFLLRRALVEAGRLRERPAPSRSPPAGREEPEEQEKDRL